MSKYMKTPKRPRKRMAVILLSMVLLVSACVVGTLAYLQANTSDVTNTFTPGTVPVSVVEEFKNNTKTNVQFRNDGNVPAYIRAKVVFTWRDAQGNIAPFGVTADDYDIVINNVTYSLTDAVLQNDWVKNGDYYYYTKPVAAGGGLTGILFDTVTYKEKEGYELHMEILAQSIQADGKTENGTKAVVDAWGVDPSTLGQSGT